MSGLRPNFSLMNRSLVSIGRPYIHDNKPSANMFLARWPSFFDAPMASTAPSVSVVIGTGSNLVVGQLPGFQRVVLVADFGQVALGELVGVGDHQPTDRQVGDVGLQRRRVHRHQHVGPVTGGKDVVVGDLNLERRDAGQRALRRADLGGVARLGRQVVTEKRCLGSKPVPGELHAVTGVPGETDDDFFQLFPFGQRRIGSMRI